MPTYGYTAWENFIYDADLGAALYDQAHGSIPDGSFVRLDTVQLACTATAVQDPDLATLVLYAFGADGVPVTYARHHSVNGDGMAVTDWITIPAAPAGAWDGDGDTVANFAHTYDLFGNPNSDGDTVVFATPTWTISGGLRHVTVTWTLTGSADITAWYISGSAQAFTRDGGELFTGGPVDGVTPVGSGATFTADLTDLTVSFDIADGDYYAISIGVAFTLTGGFTARNFANFPALTATIDDDVALDAPTLVTSGRGYNEVASYTNSDDSTLHDGTAVMVGRLETSTAVADGDIAEVEVTTYQGAFHVRGGTDPTAHFPPSDPIPYYDTDMLAQYGTAARYEYRWDAQTLVAAYAVPRTAVVGFHNYDAHYELPDTPDHVESRYLTSTSDMTTWRLPSDLVADTPEVYATPVHSDSGGYSVSGTPTEGAVGVGVVVHVSSQRSMDETATTALSTTEGTAKGNFWYTVPVGYVRITGQRRIKFELPQTLADDGKSGRVAFTPV